MYRLYIEPNRPPPGTHTYQALRERGVGVADASPGPLPALNRVSLDGLQAAVSVISVPWRCLTEARRQCSVSVAWCQVQVCARIRVLRTRCSPDADRSAKEACGRTVKSHLFQIFSSGVWHTFFRKLSTPPSIALKARTRSASTG